MATTNMHNLTTLIKRLEAATSRLEDIATSSTTPENSPPHPSAATTNGLATRSQELLNSPNAGASRAPSTPSLSLPKSEPLPAEIGDFDTLIKGDLAAFVKLSENLDPLLAQQAKALNTAFESQRQFILISTKAKKPDMGSSEYMDILKDTQENMMAVIEIRLANRASPLKDHLAMVADSAETLGWVTLDEKPADYVAELFGGAQMYGNKVLKQYKDKDEAQTDWVKAFYKLMRSLIAYTKQHQAKGLQWNPKGVSAAEALRQVKSTPNGVSPAPSAGGPPPPPPPMPPHLAGGAPPPGQAKAPASDMGAVFQQLNQGSSVTSGLKKVDPSQMTHKNPSLRAAAPVPTRSDSQSSGKSTAPPGKKPKPESMRVKKPPKKELDGNKWLIENYDSPSSPIEIDAEINQFILITKCKNTTIRVKGKANAISIDSSEKTSIVIDSLISSVDVIKCPSFALQVLGTLPTVLLDQVDGATIYLSKDSLETEFLTSKCTAVNIYLPPVKEDDDYKECNVPEQFRSVIKGGKLVTEIVEHSG